MARLSIEQWRYQAPPAQIPKESGRYAHVVAIPARDEETLIERCLRALAAQEDAGDFAVVLFLNNCRDRTAEVVRRAAHALPYALYVFSAPLPIQYSDAAWARRLAMNAATALAREDGLILSTDADSFVSPHWIADCDASIQAGADLVCGFVAPDFSDAPALDFDTLRNAAREYEYSQLAAELDALIDPDPYDPWPRHQMETGANLAIRAEVLKVLGGVPHVCPGEDQALVCLARNAGFRMRHDFKPHVTTSSRIEGRAAGGWAADVRARAARSSLVCHEKLEPARNVLYRASLKAELRRVFPGPDYNARVRRLVDADAFNAILAATSFEQAWLNLERASALLAPHPLQRAALEENLVRLRAAVEARRALLGERAATHAC